MSDLIKREDAIKAIDELPNAYNGWSDAYDKAYIISTLEEVPSADRPSAVDLSSVYSTAYKSGYEKGKADRPQGEWIFVPTFPNNKSEYPMGSLKCSVCGSHHANESPCNFCDNCGARMKGADDD